MMQISKKYIENWMSYAQLQKTFLKMSENQYWPLRVSSPVFRVSLPVVYMQKNGPTYPQFGRTYQKSLRGCCGIEKWDIKMILIPLDRSESLLNQDKKIATIEPEFVEKLSKEQGRS